MFFSLDFYVMPAFSIPTINTIGLCVVVAELSELVSRPRGASDPSSSPIRNILVLFLRIPDESNYFYSSGTIPDELNYLYSLGFLTNSDNHYLFC